MQNSHDAFETRKQPFIGAFSICMTVHLMYKRSFLCIKCINQNKN